MFRRSRDVGFPVRSSGADIGRSRSPAIGIERRHASRRWRFPSLPFRCAKRVRNSTLATFPAAPL